MAATIALQNISQTTFDTYEYYGMNNHSLYIIQISGMEHLGMDTVSYEQEGLVQFVIDSVYALAQAVHNLLTDTCTGDFKDCPTIDKLSGPEVLGYIRNVSFQGEQCLNVSGYIFKLANVSWIQGTLVHMIQHNQNDKP